jgi:hypothetical protein
LIIFYLFFSAHENDSLSPARGIRLQSSGVINEVYQPPQQRSWQPSSIGTRPKIESFAPQQFDTIGKLSTELPSSSIPGNIDAKARPQSAIVTSSHIQSTSNEKNRPISASHVPTLQTRETLAMLGGSKPSLTLDGERTQPASSAVLSATRALTEAIYSSGYYKAQPGPQNKLGPIPFSAYNSTGNSNVSKPRASSATRRPPQQHQPQQQQFQPRSAVDRALSVGRHSQHLLKSEKDSNNSGIIDPKTRNAKLAEMFEGNIIEKLDIALGTKR